MSGRKCGSSSADTNPRTSIAATVSGSHTFSMVVSAKHDSHNSPKFLNWKKCSGLAHAAAVCFLAICAMAASAKADEIRLKDGKKLYGVIVAYEDNMFKVKTDFGYVLVEKDKIASIVPTTPGATASAAKTESKPPAPAKKDVAPKNAPAASPEMQPAVALPANTTPGETDASTKASVEKREKTIPKITNAAVKPSLPANTAATNTVAANAPAPAMKMAPPPTATMVSAAMPVAPPKVEPPANHEEVQGTVYTNHTYGFRMYKAPSWGLLTDARNALPNAVVAMGTSNESTLMVVGQEKTKDSLDVTAASIEKRLRDVYQNYQQVSQRKLTVGGLPAKEYRYRGTADDHDWSGTLVIILRGSDIFTVLGMTYADNDLIQIQENVIAKAVLSMDFNVH